MFLRYTAGMLAGLACALVAQAADTETPLELQTLDVTGTHLERDAAVDPVVAFDRDELVRSGHSTLGRFLQALPMMSGSPLSSSTNRRGSGGGLSRGIESVELRGLGAQRTLILLNGRRMLAGGNGASGVVDLASLPLAMIERIEVLTSSASVAYGADAIAGVVNVLTRKHVAGVEMSARSGLTERGDGGVLDLSAVAGRRIGQTQFNAGITLHDQQSVGRADRSFSSRWLTVSGPDNVIVPTGSSAPPNGRFRTSDGNVTLIEGEDGDRAEDFRPFINEGPDTDRFNFNPFEDLIQDSRRVSVFTTLRHDLSPSLSLTAELLFQQRDSDTQIAPLPFFTNRLPGVTVSEDNFYNPFGEEITDARRRLVEAGPRRFVQDNQLWMLALGADGLLGPWHWQTQVQHGRNRVRQTQTGDLRRDRVAAALGPSFVDNGVARCGTPDDVVPGCVPLNLFGGPGSITADMLDWAGLSALTDRQVNEESLLSASAYRDAWAMPGGFAGLAVGIDVRSTDAEDVPDAQTRAGNTTGAARQTTQGGFDSRALFAEFALPLLANRPAVRQLDLELGLRWVDYSNFDAETIFDAALRYAASDWLTLRLGYGEAFRAPTVGELFGGASESNPIVEDPCADFSSLSQTEMDRCVAQGVPADGSFNQTGNEVPAVGGGNPRLSPERATSFTSGLILNWPAFPNARLSIDYFDIEIHDGITALGASTLLSQCIATGRPTFCDRIQRNPDGSIASIQRNLQNAARETARGVDIEFGYRHATAIGELNHRLLLSRLLERSVQAFDGAQPLTGVGRYDADNFGVIPAWKGTYVASWNWQRWFAGYALEWIDEIEDQGGDLAPGTRYAVGSRLYHDVHLGYRGQHNLSLVIGIDNVTDRAPPFIPNGGELNTDESAYRLLGRRYWLRLTHRF